MAVASGAPDLVLTPADIPGADLSQLLLSLSSFRPLGSRAFLDRRGKPFPQGGYGIAPGVAVWEMPRANTMVRLDVTLLEVKHSKPDGSPA